MILKPLLRRYMRTGETIPAHWLWRRLVTDTMPAALLILHQSRQPYFNFNSCLFLRIITPKKGNPAIIQARKCKNEEELYKLTLLFSEEDSNFETRGA